jgi:hypothetical protein
MLGNFLKHAQRRLGSFSGGLVKHLGHLAGKIAHAYNAPSRYVAGRIADAHAKHHIPHNTVRGEPVTQAMGYPVGQVMGYPVGKSA